MSLSESIDSVPAFKTALKELEEEFSGRANLEAIVEEVLAFSHTLNRRAEITELRNAVDGLQTLLKALAALSSGTASFQTSVFSADHFANDSLSDYFDELFTKLSASLPNIFVSDGAERAAAVKATRKQLEEIGRFADLQGNSHVVSLSEAMVAVVDYHKESLDEGRAGTESAQLVKPLLRGFALLRTAFDSPDEPNLSPALIDSTANLRDLIGAGTDDGCATDDLGFDSGAIISSVLTDETVVELDETKRTAGPGERSNRNKNETLRSTQPEQAVDTRRTMALTSVQPLLRKTPITPTKDVNVLLLGLEDKTSWLLPFAQVLPLHFEHLTTPDHVEEKVTADTLDLIICNADLDDALMTTIVDAIAKRRMSQPLQLIVATLCDDSSVTLHLQSHDDQLAAFNLKPLEEGDFPKLIKELQEKKK